MVGSSWYHIEQLNKSHHEMQRNQSEIQTKYEKERLEASEKFDKMQKKIESEIWYFFWPNTWLFMNSWISFQVIYV